MIKIISLLAIFAITISFGIQYADAQFHEYAAVPDPPTNLTAVVADERVTLSWTAPPTGSVPIIQYIITGTEINCVVESCDIIEPLENNASFDDPHSFRNYTAPATSYTVSDLDNTKDYTFRVQSVNVAGPSIIGPGERSSPTITIERGVQNLTVSDISTTTASVSWDEPNNSAITRYDIIVRDIETGTQKVRINNLTDAHSRDVDSTPNSIKVNLTGLTPRNVHSFEVIAKQAGIPENVSVSINEKMHGAPGAPSNLKIKDLNSGSITLEWNADDLATYYRWSIMDLTENRHIVTDRHLGKVTEATTSLPADGKLYRFSVTAYNDQGRGGTSTIIAQAIAGLGGVKNLSSESTSDSITLSWMQPNDKTSPSDPNDLSNGYSITVTSQGEFIKFFFVPDVSDQTEYEWTISDLTPNKTYTFLISVVDSDSTKFYTDTSITVTTESTSQQSTQQSQQRETQQEQGNTQPEIEIQESKQEGEKQQEEPKQIEIQESKQEGEKQQEEPKQIEIQESEQEGSETQEQQSEPVTTVTLNISAFSDSNGNGIQDVDESPLSRLMLLVYTPDTGAIDILFTKTDGTISKTDLTTSSFYVITYPDEGYTSSTNPFPLDDPTHWGIIYVENPQEGSIHDMNVGITRD